MSRTVKTIKDKDDNDVEVYSDNCNICSKEMVFPKAEADKVEAMFPFIKDKVSAGSPCLDCAVKQEKEQNISIFSKEEIESIKQALMKK